MNDTVKPFKRPADTDRRQALTNDQIDSDFPALSGGTGYVAPECRAGCCTGRAGSCPAGRPVSSVSAPQMAELASAGAPQS